MSNKKSGVTIAQYSSLSELREAYNLKPFVKRTNNENKLNSQREKFAERHKCKACENPMALVAGNVMSCTNPDCKGIEMRNADGSKYYIASYDLLDEKGAEIAMNIFD